MIRRDYFAVQVPAIAAFVKISTVLDIVPPWLSDTVAVKDPRPHLDGANVAVLPETVAVPPVASDTVYDGLLVYPRNISSKATVTALPSTVK